MDAIVWILGGIALLALSKARVSLSPLGLGEGYMDTFNITIVPTALDISTEIVEANVEYPLTLDPGLFPTVKVPVNYYNTDPGTWVWCRIFDSFTGVWVTNQLSFTNLLGGNGTHTFTFSSIEHWRAVMPNVPWNLTIECGISWL